MRLNRLLLPLLVVAAVVAWQALAPSQSPIGTQPAPEAQHDVSPSPVPSEAEAYADEVERAFEEERSGLMVTAAGTVKRLLSDDRDGSRHQRFVIGFPSGHTVLVAHNIDLAPRVAGLQVGDAVRVHGQYEWNERGGVIHWTHHDPDGTHAEGWVEHDGRRYE